MSGEMVCVYNAGTVSEADIVAAWLDERGIPAFVPNRLMAETLPIDIHFSGRGVEVCVSDDEQAARAKELLEQHSQQILIEHGPPVDDLFADVNCGECDTACSFPLSSAGSTQSCPNCGAYIDVPKI